MAGAGVSILSRSDVQNLAVIYGKQNLVPIPLYDTVVVANGNANPVIQFFANTRGAQGIAVTNMEQPNQLISGKSFVCEEIALDVGTSTGAYVALTAADIMLLTHATASFTFKINNVEYAQGLVKDLIGNGLFGFGTGLAALGTTIPYVTPRNGVRGFKLNPALVIPTQTGFALEFDYQTAPNPAASVVLRPKLLGTMIRLTSA
jgi:hypothetical protein